MERQTEPLGLQAKLLSAAAVAGFAGLIGWSLYNPPRVTDEKKLEEFMKGKKPKTGPYDIFKILRESYGTQDKLAFRLNENIYEKKEGFAWITREEHSVNQTAPTAVRLEKLVEQMKETSDKNTIIVWGPEDSRLVQHMYRIIPEHRPPQEEEAMIHGYRTSTGAYGLLIVGTTPNSMKRTHKALSLNADVTGASAVSILVTGTTAEDLSLVILKER